MTMEMRAAVVERLRAARHAGRLSGEAVAATAAVAAVSERTVWRWVTSERDADGSSGGRGRYLLSDRARELFYVWHGNVAAVRRALIEEGHEVPSARTLERAVARELGLMEREYAVAGVEGARRRGVYLRHEARRAQCFEADHKELSLLVLAPRAQRPRPPWVTLVIDQFSRLIVGWVISLRPSSAEVLAALRMAVMVDPERGPFGGVPVVLRWDNGLEFAARAIEDAALGLGCAAQPTMAYSPWQKGKIERLNRTIEQELLCGLPAWRHGRRGADGRLIDTRAPLTLERFVAIFDAWVTRYNTVRAHRALGGLTPLERWQSDSTPVRSLTHQEARWLLQARVERQVNKDGIHFGGLIYVAPELNGLVGETLLVAYMPHDQRQIELYRDGQWLASARPQGQLSAAERDAVLARRRADAAHLARQAARARRRARARLAPVTSPEQIEMTTVITASADQGRGPDRSRRAALRLLRLEDQVNRPREHSGEQAQARR